jgi:hypothetical protein
MIENELKFSFFTGLFQLVFLSDEVMVFIDVFWYEKYGAIFPI